MAVLTAGKIPVASGDAEVIDSTLTFNEDDLDILGTATIHGQINAGSGNFNVNGAGGTTATTLNLGVNGVYGALNLYNVGGTVTATINGDSGQIVAGLNGIPGQFIAQNTTSENTIVLSGMDGTASFKSGSVTIDNASVITAGGGFYTSSNIQIGSGGGSFLLGGEFEVNSSGDLTMAGDLDIGGSNAIITAAGDATFVNISGNGSGITGLALSTLNNVSTPTPAHLLVGDATFDGYINVVQVGGGSIFTVNGSTGAVAAVSLSLNTNLVLGNTTAGTVDVHDSSNVSRVYLDGASGTVKAGNEIQVGGTYTGVGGAVSVKDSTNANTVQLNGAAGTVLALTDIESTTIGSGFILKSPDGTRWRIAVDNSGTLTAATA